MGIITIGFIGSRKCELKEICDLNITVPSTDTQRIQEGHILIGHIIYEAVENHALNSNYYKLTNILNGAIISIDGT